TGPSRVSYQPVAIPPPAGSKDPGRELVSYAIEPVAPAAAGVRGLPPPLKFFAGPKDFDVLASTDPTFVRAIDFGIFACLVVPMLLTFPVLFAFYSLLSTAIELRGAPFLGWIHDLSVHDPLYITPVLMGLSQFWQTRITPAAGADPAQQKMMMMMPLVFAFMFLWAPAGVAIYWLVSNLWGNGQKYLTNYLIGRPTIRTVRPPAQRQ